eukprot:368608-Prymnesium_polylepis.1
MPRRGAGAAKRALAVRAAHRRRRTEPRCKPAHLDKDQRVQPEVGDAVTVDKGHPGCRRRGR